MRKLLFWLGVLFIVQGAIIGAMQSRPTHIDLHDPWQHALAGVQVDLLGTGQRLESIMGSLFGALGLWLLCVFLKLREAERQITELRGQLARLIPISEKPPEVQ